MGGVGGDSPSSSKQRALVGASRLRLRLSEAAMCILLRGSGDLVAG